MNTRIIKYLDARFIGIFLLLFVGLHFFHLFYYGITTPDGRFYSSFLENNLNYIEWVKGLILQLANILAHIMGLSSHIEHNLTLQVYDRPGVNLNYTCLGLDLCSFWIAFVIALSRGKRQIIKWVAIGAGAIWLINAFRIALLLLSMERHWRESRYLDHHDLFTYTCYIAILMMIYFYDKSLRSRSLNRQTLAA